jgi:hypothetical protein
LREAEEETYRDFFGDEIKEGDKVVSIGQNLDYKYPERYKKSEIFTVLEITHSSKGIEVLFEEINDHKYPAKENAVVLEKNYPKFYQKMKERRRKKGLGYENSLGEFYKSISATEDEIEKAVNFLEWLDEFDEEELGNEYGDGGITEQNVRGYLRRAKLFSQSLAESLHHFIEIGWMPAVKGYSDVEDVTGNLNSIINCFRGTYRG